MNEEEGLAAIIEMAQRQQEQIRRLVNLLLDVLDKKHDSEARASHYIFIETELYKEIEAGNE